MPQKRPATMRTIAEEAGCSVNSVSLAFHRHPSIPAATRERIFRIAERQGYRFNRVVSAVMRQQKRRRSEESHGTLAFLTSHFSEDGWRKLPQLQEFFRGAEQRAAESEYGLEPIWADPQMSSRRLSQILWTRGIEGVLVPPLPPHRETIDLDWSRFCAVALGRSLRKPELDRVSPSWFHSATETFRRLWESGHSRVGLLVNPTLESRTDRAACAAHSEWLREHPEAADVPRLVQTSESSLGGIGDWVREHDLSAVVSGLGFSRRNRIRLCRETGAFLAYLSCPAGDPGSNGMAFDRPGLGAAAIDHLLAQLLYHRTGPPAQPREVLIEGSWRVSRARRARDRR